MGDYDPTRPFASEEPDPTYDWDDDSGSPKLLWGRVLALAAVLILAFLLGRATAPDDSASEVEDLKAQLAQVSDELEAAQEQIDFGATNSPPPDDTGTESPPPDDTTETESPPPDDTGGGEVKEYTVKQGDTYNEIAEKFFKDPSKGACIADANDGQTLIVGETINVPDACGDE